MKPLLIAVLIAACAAMPVQAQTPSPSVGQQTQTPRASAEPTNQSAEEIIIKEKLKASGLKDIKGLVRNPDGTWQGKARRDKTEIAVQVDTAGNVTFQ